MWKVVDVYWTDFVNQLIMECGECGTRFRWSSNISVCCCPCGACAYWHDFNGSEEAKYPVAEVALEDENE